MRLHLRCSARLKSLLSAMVADGMTGRRAPRLEHENWWHKVSAISLRRCSAASPPLAPSPAPQLM